MKQLPKHITHCTLERLFGGLNIPDESKFEIREKFNDEDILLAVERTIAWVARDDDLSGMSTSLRRRNTWTDNCDLNEMKCRVRRKLHYISSYAERHPMRVLDLLNKFDGEKTREEIIELAKNKSYLKKA
jgi:hypothetical protein